MRTTPAAFLTASVLATLPSLAGAQEINAPLAHVRIRGVRGTRMTLFMHRNDMERLSLAEGDIVPLTTEMGDTVERHVDGFIVTPHDIPEGCVAAYYPEANPLIPMWHKAKGADTPAAKSIPASIVKLAKPPEHLEANDSVLSLTAG